MHIWELLCPNQSIITHLDDMGIYFCDFVALDVFSVVMYSFFRFLLSGVFLILELVFV